jgi:hypothetical protein
MEQQTQVAVEVVEVIDNLHQQEILQIQSNKVEQVDQE